MKKKRKEALGDDIKKGEASLWLFLYSNLAPVFLVCKTLVFGSHISVLVGVIQHEK